MQILFDRAVLVIYRALSDTVFPGKPIPLGERVFGVEDPCPSFDSAASAHRMRTPWGTWLGFFRRPPPLDTGRQHSVARGLPLRATVRVGLPLGPVGSRLS